MPYVFTQGETIAFPLLNNNAVATTSITAKLKAKVANAPSGSPVATFVVTPVADLGGGNGPGWALSLSDTISASLPVGDYLVDARVVLAGGLIEITDMETVTIQPGVTVTA